MNKETKKAEDTEQEAKQDVKPSELSDKDLDNIAGGGKTKINGSRSNIKSNLA